MQKAADSTPATHELRGAAQLQTQHSRGRDQKSKVIFKDAFQKQSKCRAVTLQGRLPPQIPQHRILQSRAVFSFTFQVSEGETEAPQDTHVILGCVKVGLQYSSGPASSWVPALLLRHRGETHKPPAGACGLLLGE